ncbi:PR/SET domain 13 [Halictus rubicundus]|uniref:PR/SET domain 13 n=1 Tax=Halictus rubicundus TaxID=77578 RepID=UPI00403581EC
MYPPFLADRALIMSIEAFQRSSLTQPYAERPIVRAAGILYKDSTTELIDVNRLAQNTTSVIQYVEVADANGRLYCVDGLVSAACWLKIITLAKDCQSSNIVLMSTNEGVMLKVARYIAPGEPLLLWFTEHVIALMSMPFLTPSHIQGQNRYVCHVCHSLFEYPNPLKVHLALNCSRLDISHLWTVLAREFTLAQRRSLSLSLSSFEFELSGSPQSSPPRISPVQIESTDSNLSLTNNSPSSWNQPSPSSSSNQPSPTPSFNQLPSTSLFNQPSPSSSFNQPSPSSSFNQPSPSSSFNQPSPPSLFNQPSPSSLFNQPSPSSLFNQPSPSSSFIQTSPTTSSSTQISPSSSSQVLPLEKELRFRHSAFRPYLNQPSVVTSAVPLPREETALAPFNAQPNLPPIPADVHAAQMETIVSNLGKSKQGHLCIYCGKVYSRKYGLKIHIRTHTGYKPLKCKYCQRPFGDPSNLNKHVRLHSDGETPYRCELCGKVLVRRRDLERHTRSRHQNNVEEASDSSSDGIDV